MWLRHKLPVWHSKTDNLEVFSNLSVIDKREKCIFYNPSNGDSFAAPTIVVDGCCRHSEKRILQGIHSTFSAAELKTFNLAYSVILQEIRGCLTLQSPANSRVHPLLCRRLHWSCHLTTVKQIQNTKLRGWGKGWREPFPIAGLLNTL